MATATNNQGNQGGCCLRIPPITCPHPRQSIALPLCNRRVNRHRWLPPTRTICPRSCPARLCMKPASNLPMYYYFVFCTSLYCTLLTIILLYPLYPSNLLPLLIHLQFHHSQVSFTYYLYTHRLCDPLLSFTFNLCKLGTSFNLILVFTRVPFGTSLAIERMMCICFKKSLLLIVTHITYLLYYLRLLKINLQTAKLLEFYINIRVP